jgi:uncharacterized RDD family membrane protein YckC
MAGFCEVCGRSLGIAGCPSGHTTTIVGKNSSPVPALPKSKTAPRLLCSGAEFGGYFIAALLIAGMDVLSAGLAGLACLPLAVLIGLRDVSAGSFNPGKRISNVRVVDYRTGKSASNLQALGRNSYYCGLLLVAALPLIDVATSPLFASFVVLDVIAIISNPKGRRLGDFIAGTQVVGTRD